MYKKRSAPSEDWSPPVDYNDRPARRLSKWIFVFALATILLILSVAALVIVFAVESSWFSDNFRPNTTNAVAQNYTNRYGLWRLCFYPNQTCESWFLTEGANAIYIEQRLSQGRVGINAWQALEIVFLFINACTAIIAVIALLAFCVRWRNAHYYLAILTVFCIWPAVCTGIAGLFVFGFSVFNVSTTPRSLEWCFYVNIAAVALSLLAAILLTIYDIFLKSPKKKTPSEDRILTTFPDFLTYPTPAPPSSLVLVERSKQPNNQRSKTYEYAPRNQPVSTSQSTYQPTNNYMPSGSQQMMTPYPNPNRYQPQPPMNAYRTVDYSFPGIPVSPSSTMISTQMPAYRGYLSSSDWGRPDASLSSTMMRADGEVVNSYVQRGMYRPDEQPSLNPHSSSSQGFNPIDPSDIVLSQQQPPYMASSAYRYTPSNFY